MQANEPISCPIDGTTVNENVVRTVAVFVTVLATISLFFNLYIITLFLIFDFAFRAFFDGKFSLLKWLSAEITKILKIQAKPTDGAPKKFAALLGFIFVNIIFVLQYFNFRQTAIIVGLLLIVCAFLEGFLGYCVGCVIYQLLQKFK
jgi:hypothetical protein